MTDIAFEILPCSELFTEPHSELMKLFWEGYEGRVDAKLHDTDERVSRVIAVRQSNGALGAAALLEGVRIAAITTATDRRIRARSELGHTLLRAVHNDGVASWMTIAEDKPVVQNLAASTGMHPINNAEKIAGFFASLNRPKDYHVEYTKDDLAVVINGPRSSRPNYRQQVWAWEDKITLG